MRITSSPEDPILALAGLLVLFGAALIFWGLVLAFDRWHQRATARWAVRKVMGQDARRARRPPPGPPYRMPGPPTCARAEHCERLGYVRVENRCSTCPNRLRAEEEFPWPAPPMPPVKPPRVDVPPVNEDR